MLKTRLPKPPNINSASPNRRPYNVELRDTVVLALDPTCGAEHPRQLALAYMSRRLGLSWLIMAERRWGTAASAKSAAHLGGRFGHGLPPALVAQELTEAIAGRRVCTEDRHAAASVLERLFAGTGTPPPTIELGEIIRSFLPSRSDDASEVLYRVRSRISRDRCLSGSLAAEAAYHRDVLRLLAARARR